jgi:hypothetical protein
LSSYGRPLHLPPPTGCTIPGCLDCGHNPASLGSAVEAGSRRERSSGSGSGDSSKSPTLESSSMDVIEVDSGKEDEIIDMK